MPIEPGRAGCAVMSSGFAGTPTDCQQLVTHAGLVYFPGTKRLWWVFACDVHKDRVEAARPLNDRDRVELARRRVNWEAALEGRGRWVPNEPLAVGVEARRILERVRATGGSA